MEIFGYLLAIGIGVLLGLIGSGGSILTLPLLVYIFNVNAILATTYSLFIVGWCSVIATVSYWRKGLVNFKFGLLFGVPSILAVLITRAYLLPLIPETVFAIKNFVITKEMFLMLLFALLMLLASYSMLKKDTNSNTITTPQLGIGSSILIVIVEGVVVGILTGLVGAGGGFLIVPALMLISKMPIKNAIGTSLLIITFKSLIGFFADSNLSIIDYKFLFFLSLFPAIGIFIGTNLSSKISTQKLKPLFAYFIIIMACYIFVKELFF